MARQIILNKAVQHPDGRFEIVYTLNGGGGQGTIWSSRDDMLNDTVRRLDSDELAIAFLMGYWQGRDADFGNPAIVLNKTLTIDFTAPNPIRLQ